MSCKALKENYPSPLVFSGYSFFFFSRSLFSVLLVSQAASVDGIGDAENGVRIERKCHQVSSILTEGEDSGARWPGFSSRAVPHQLCDPAQVNLS